MIVKSGFQNKPVTPVASASWGDHISNFCTLPLLYVQETCHPVHIGARWQRQLPVLCHNLGHGYFFCEQTHTFIYEIVFIFSGEDKPTFFLSTTSWVPLESPCCRHQRSLCPTSPAIPPRCWPRRRGPSPSAAAPGAAGQTPWSCHHRTLAASWSWYKKTPNKMPRLQIHPRFNLTVKF